MVASRSGTGRLETWNSNKWGEVNSMDLATQFANACADAETIPGVRAELETFQSGALALRIWVADRFFVMDYLPSYGGIGVDEVRDDDAFTVGYNHWFTDFDEARLMLLSIIGTAAALPPCG
jgi:hypothetical protein